MWKKIVVFALFFLISGYGGIFADDFIIDDGSSAAPTESATVTGNGIPVIGSIPTPDNYQRGAFLSQFLMYDHGGVSTRIAVGIFDTLSIGVAENFDSLIGENAVHLNIPSAYLKFSIFPVQTGFNVAFGFDSFAYGSNGSVMGTNGTSATQYGFFVSGGKAFSFFGARNLFSFGLRFPLLPAGFRNITNASAFAGITLGSKVLKAGFTVENIYLDFKRGNLILPSVIFSYKPVVGFSLNLALQYQLYNRLVNRVFSLDYLSSF